MEFLSAKSFSSCIWFEEAVSDGIGRVEGRLFLHMFNSIKPPRLKSLNGLRQLADLRESREHPLLQLLQIRQLLQICHLLVLSSLKYLISSTPFEITN